MTNKQIFDIGAHQGEDTDYYLKRGFRVVSFECNPDNIAVLEQRFSSEIAEGTVKLEKRALKQGRHGQLIEFFRDKNSVWGTTKENWAQRNNSLGSTHSSIKVECLDPNAIFGLYGAAHYIKIDIEGDDLEALSSLTTLDAASRPAYVSIESNKRDFTALQKEFSVLTYLGYEKFQIVGQRNNHKKTSNWVDSKLQNISYKHLLHSSGPFGPDLKKSKWLTHEEALSRYRWIFIQYRLFGDYGVFNLTKLPRFLRYLILLPLWWRFFAPDWYDTHAAKQINE